MLLTQLPLLGLHLAIIRDCAAKPTKQARFVGAGLSVAIPVAVLVGFVLWYLLPIVYPQPLLQGPVQYVAAAILPLGVIAVFEAAFIGLQRLKTLALFSMAEVIVRFAGSAIILNNGGDIDGLFILFLITKIMLSVSFLVFWKFFIPAGASTNIWLRILFVLKEYIRKVPVFAGILFVSAFALRIDTLWLSWVSDLEQVGMYAAPFKLYEVAMMVPGMMATVLLSMFSNLVVTSRLAFNNLFVVTVKIYLLTGIVPVVIFIMMSEQVITMVFGDQYAEGAGILSLLVATALLNALDQVVTMGMLATGMQKIDLLVASVTLLIVAAGLALLIPNFGAAGAALSVLIAALIRLTIRSLIFYKTQGCNPFSWGVLHPILFVIGVVWVLAGMLSFSSVYLIMVLVPCYLVYLVVTRVVSREEVVKMGQMMKKNG